MILARLEYHEMTYIDTMKSAVVVLKSDLASWISPAVAAPLLEGAYAMDADVVHPIVHSLPDKRRGI